MADATYKKIDDNTIEITAVKTEVTAISVFELKNRIIDLQSNIDYGQKQWEERRGELQGEIDVINQIIVEAEKLGIKLAASSNAEIKS